MLTFIARRLLALLPVCLGVVIIVALLIHLVPGDPVDLILEGSYATEKDKQELRKEMGLDRPIPQQTMSYISGILHGDLGTSVIYKRPVLDLILERIPATVELAIISMVVALAMSIPLGVVSAVFAGSAIDFFAMTIALLGVAIPNFWLGPLLILLFSINLGWFPVSERSDFSSYILPAITLGTALAAILSRMTRNSMLDNLKEDYTRTARAKGTPEFVVIWKHVFRNAALPLVTIIGLQFGVLLTGAIITERVFDWPGVGTLIIDGINNRDYPVVQGCVLVFSASYLFVNLITDLVYALVDPRIKQ